MKVGDLVRLKYGEFVVPRKTIEGLIGIGKKAQADRLMREAVVKNELNKQRVEQYGFGMVVEAHPDWDGEVSSTLIWFEKANKEIRLSPQLLEIISEGR